MADVCFVLFVVWVGSACERAMTQRWRRCGDKQLNVGEKFHLNDVGEWVGGRVVFSEAGWLLPLPPALLGSGDGRSPPPPPEAAHQAAAVADGVGRAPQQRPLPEPA